MPKKTKVPRVCFDRVLPRELMRQPNIVQPARGPARALSPLGKLWMNGTTLRVRFLGGTASQQAIAREQAGWWTAHANLKFDFTHAPDAEIRVSFNPSSGAWSYVGTDVRSIPAGQPTMNLGFLDGGTAGHEFGHAVGLAHEHQNPRIGIQWNEPAVIQALAGPPNYWSEEQTRHNVLFKYSLNQINGTDFDPESIMLYFFPAEWTLNGIATHQNDVLSAMDKAFIASARMYPRTSPGVSAAVELKVNGNRLQASIGKPMEEDLFKFTVTAARRHLIETRGPTDVVMKLFGPNSQTSVIAEDDDSGIDANARIIADLVPGDYYAQIRHWNQEKGTGDYTIRVASV